LKCDRLGGWRAICKLHRFSPGIQHGWDIIIAEARILCLGGKYQGSGRTIGYTSPTELLALSGLNFGDDGVGDG
jgi:hypothetical protein